MSNLIVSVGVLMLWALGASPERGLSGADIAGVKNLAEASLPIGSRSVVVPNASKAIDSYIAGESLLTQKPGRFYVHPHFDAAAYIARAPYLRTTTINRQFLETENVAIDGDALCNASSLVEANESGANQTVRLVWQRDSVNYDFWPMRGIEFALQMTQLPKCCNEECTSESGNDRCGKRRQIDGVGQPTNHAQVPRALVWLVVTSPFVGIIIGLALCYRIEGQCI